MATVTEGFLHLDEKIKGQIRTGAAQNNTVSALGIREPVDLTNSSVLSFINYTGSQVVGEGEAKVETPFESKVAKKQDGMLQSQVRMSIQAMRKSEANKVEMLKAAQEKISKGYGKDLDIVMLHNTTPHTGAASNLFTDGIATGSDTLVHEIGAGEREDAALRAAIVELGSNEKEITGIAVTPQFFYRLAYLVDNNGRPLYPQLTMTGEENLYFDGIKLVKSTALGTKSHLPKTDTATGIEFIVGDFTNIVWGSKIDSIELITTGDPDNSGRDLKGHNEVMLRMESWLEYVVTDKDAFVVGKKEA